ncbi:MAG: hypothetical protein CVU57_22325 [Deltaproteobacteria bacterium HGW-Deltaproteobacteria-15]|nr:MAG: hypothetical protein CVU57_22325 [Deltaproteobacteria bacterium HGW-Deltaproteobacteria-15]
MSKASGECYKITQVLLVVLFTNLGATIGTLVAIPLLRSNLSGSHLLTLSSSPLLSFPLAPCPMRSALFCT